MSRSSRAGLAMVVLAILWIVVYWRTTPPALDLIDTPAPAAVASRTTLPSPALTPQIPTPAPTVADAPHEPPAGPPPAPRPAPGDVIPPTFDLYPIEPGDTAQSISRKRWGTSAHWRAVLRANPLTDFSRIKPGQTIKVPRDPDNVQGVVVEPETDAFVEYTVAPGDTLSAIAAARYGKSSLWRRILDANRDKLNDDATNLRPGMKLKVPSPTQSPPR